MKVFVYFNLHKQVFSVKALEGDDKGKVIAHRNEVTLSNVRFKVSEAGRQRVLRERRKNVHAGVVGEWTDVIDQKICKKSKISVTYNPYKYNSFVLYDNRQPVLTARHAYLKDKRIWICT